MWQMMLTVNKVITESSFTISLNVTPNFSFDLYDFQNTYSHSLSYVLAFSPESDVLSVLRKIESRECVCKCGSFPHTSQCQIYRI